MKPAARINTLLSFSLLGVIGIGHAALSVQQFLDYDLRTSLQPTRPDPMKAGDHWQSDGDATGFSPLSGVIFADVNSRQALRIALNSVGGGNIVVLYPESAEPFRSVFKQIISGIEDKTANQLITIPVGNNPNIAEITSELKRQDVRVIIALGRNGLKAALAVNMDVKIVAGGLISPPENEGRPLTLLSLAPDPALLFDRLKTLMPGVRRVHVVYDPRNSGWLIRLARDAARNAGLEFIPLEATDLKSALQQYQTLFASADPRRDAVWLPQDATTTDDTTILPVVLQESWTRNVAVFSSTLSHVKRGALFSLYPNTTSLGRNLASTALDSLSGNSQPFGTLPLKAVQVAVNLRTASHLGLSLSGRQQQGFDLVFSDP